MKLLALLDYFSEQYYNGTPIISDEEFDALADTEGYTTIGKAVEKGYPHLFPLFSLQKIYKGESEDPFATKYNKNSIVVTAKLDGAAVALTYLNGELVRCLSRGDGKKGEDITSNLKEIVPNKLPKAYVGVVQITGEVVAPSTIPNARNYAAGAINLKDSKEFKSRDLKFVAYGVQPYQTKTWLQDMSDLKSVGFFTVIDSDWKEYPRDGLVFRLSTYEVFEEQGYTSHHPRGMYALKERESGVETTLLDVIWQVGKSGVVSPVAILDPIMIEDAKIERATLHNIKYIEGLGLEIGCRVEVVRSGKIIPRVVRRVM